ncbi:SDF-domain-containing protein [Backusella circina FSU 941]|nr:SDF-domain-containing protein [Backusella circina FSU 941]
MEEITRQQQTTETASSEKRQESYVENAAFYDNDSTYNNRAHIPEHLQIPPASEGKGYPGWLVKPFKTIQEITYFCLRPFFTALRYLNEKTNLTFWIIFAMVIGILVGRFAPEAGKAIKPLGDAFIQMIKIIIVPLVFSVLVIGIAGHGDDISKVGKLAIKTIIYFEVVTTLALAVGLIMANIVKPGVGVVLPTGEDTSSVTELANQEKTDITWDGEMFLIIPENFFVAAVENKVLSIVFCAAMFACSMMKADKRSKKVMLEINESLSQVMFKFVGLVMNYAPIGIGASLAATVGTNGISVLANLGKLIGCVYAALVIFLILVLMPIMLMARIPVLGFFKAIARPWLLAFSSASSESALPLAFERMRAFGCTNALTGFVIPW